MRTCSGLPILSPGRFDGGESEVDESGDEVEDEEEEEDSYDTAKPEDKEEKEDDY